MDRTPIFRANTHRWKNQNVICSAANINPVCAMRKNAANGRRVLSKGALIEPKSGAYSCALDELKRCVT